MRGITELRNKTNGDRSIGVAGLDRYALQKGDGSAARAWRQKSSGGILDKSRRSLADAWLAFSEGRNSDAMQQIQASRSQLSHSMDPGVAVMTKERLDLLEKEIVECRGTLRCGPG